MKAKEREKEEVSKLTSTLSVRIGKYGEGKKVTDNHQHNFRRNNLGGSAIISG